MSSNHRSKVRARLRACGTVHSPAGFAVTPPAGLRRVPCSVNTRTDSRLSSTVPAGKKPAARIPAAGAGGNGRQVGPGRRGDGSIPAACGICPMVDGATVTPGVARSPWIRRCPHRGFSFARRRPRRAVARDRRREAGPAPPARVVLSRCQLAVPGQQRRGRHGEDFGPAPTGRSGASAANHIRPAGPYRIRPAWRRSTAFSCRSTSSSASVAPCPRNISTARPSIRRTSK